jgi:quercetin dioxygenase-like cupin family protein
MPFYNIHAMEPQPDVVNPAIKLKSIAGEFIKIGIVTYQLGEGPPPHFHPNEEQFILMLEGKMNMVLGDETKVIGPGDLVHIPRNTRHGIKVVAGPAVFFACKSPVGSGHLSADYNRAPDAEALTRQLSEVPGLG